MHPALAALTPKEARLFLDDPAALAVWLEEHQLRHRDVVGVLDDLTFHDEPPPLVVRPNRRDTAALLAYVDRAVRLPPRLRAVARLCLQDGATLDQAAAQLGITRETVRVHLRRLRAKQRAADARASRGSTGPTACQ